MNNILIKISKHIKNNLETFLPEIKLSDLEENGKIYYMNGDDGTIFDWGLNERLCEFMVFYDDKTNLGAVKTLVYSNGKIITYLYKNKTNSPFKEIEDSITEIEAFELAVLLYERADKLEIFDKAIEDMNTDIEITSELKEEFLENFKEE